MHAAHQLGPLRVHEVGAGDGRLTHHLELALDAFDSTPDDTRKPHLPGRKAAAVAAAAADPGANAADAGASNSATAPAPAPALKDQEGAAVIALSASDDGSLGLHKASPFR